MAANEANLRFSNPPAVARPRGYSHVAEVLSGRTVYISGQVALNQAGELIGAGDMAAQAEQVFSNLNAALASVGADFSHVAKLTIFTTDIAEAAAIRAARDRYINLETPPASTLVEVRRLALPDLLIEVEAVAVVPA